MKKILLTFALFALSCQCVFAVEPFEAVLGTSFENFKTGIGKAHYDFPIQCESHLNNVKDAASQKWAIFDDTRGPKWVQYDASYTSRSAVDFVRGYIEIETLLENNSEQAKQQACRNLQRQLVAADENCRAYLGFAILPGLEGTVELTIKPNLPKEAFPQLYPVKKPKEQKELPSTSGEKATTPPSPPVPKSYAEEMLMRKAKPSAFAPTLAPSTYKDGLHYKTALSQYVDPNFKLYTKQYHDDGRTSHVVTNYIIADISLLEDDINVITEKFINNTVISLKIELPRDFSNKASAQYKEPIHANSERFNLAPHVIYAVMHTESNFNPFARSYSPAYGLMQLVPSTGGTDAYHYIYGKKIKPSVDFLYTPINNILFGTAYFSKVKDVYFKGIENEHNAYMATIAAYNTGIGNVSKALVGKANLKDAVNIINTMAPNQLYAALQKYLPYDETKRYLNYIMRRSELYYGQ